MPTTLCTLFLAILLPCASRDTYTACFACQVYFITFSLKCLFGVLASRQPRPQDQKAPFATYIFWPSSYPRHYELFSLRSAARPSPSLSLSLSYSYLYLYFYYYCSSGPGDTTIRGLSSLDIISRPALIVFSLSLSLFFFPFSLEISLPFDPARWTLGWVWFIFLVSPLLSLWTSFCVSISSVSSQHLTRKGSCRTLMRTRSSVHQSSTPNSSFFLPKTVHFSLSFVVFSQAG